ncbi:MAG: hypothetical protein NTX61_17495 [Bacteroidetes bacterium]|nr:hypothetical protein [Bacteroidota bacterium]
MGISLFDLAKPVEKNPATGGGINSQIILVQESDINWGQFPACDVVYGVTITQNIPLKAGKYFHRLYLTQGTIKPAQKKLKGSNQDCGGYHEVFSWRSPSTRKDSLRKLDGKFVFVIESIDSTWGEEVDKEKGSKIIFTCK